MKRQWTYHYERFDANVPTVVEIINRQHSDWDVVSIIPSPHHAVSTIVVHRTPIE